LQHVADLMTLESVSEVIGATDEVCRQGARVVLRLRLLRQVLAVLPINVLVDNRYEKRI